MSFPALPKVSVCLPVYNGSKLLRGALEKLLAQDYPHVEIIISDNASTDSTWDICQEFAGQNPHIQLYRNDTNRGAIYNFNRVLELATGEYCMFAAHDDLWEPNFITRCVELLEMNPNAVLCFFNFSIHRRHTNQYEDYDYDSNPLQATDPWERLNALMQYKPFPATMIYGVFRRSTFLKALPMYNILATDILLLLKLSTLGTFVKVDETLFIKTQEPRTLHKRPSELTQNRNLLTILKWDFALLLIPSKIAWGVAPNVSVKLKLLKTVIRFFYCHTGWPNPYKLLNRYIYFVLPETVVEKLVIWYRKLTRQQTSGNS